MNENARDLFWTARLAVEAKLQLSRQVSWFQETEASVSKAMWSQLSWQKDEHAW